MVEVQNHGFSFENWIKQILCEDKNKCMYTQKWDIPGEIPISIKFIGETNALELSSAVRFWETDKPFLLIVGRWKQKGKFKEVVSIDEILFTKEIMANLRGSLTLQELKDFNRKIVSFPAGKEGQKEGISYAKKWKQENKNKIGLITLTHKIDSKNQRRLQCNINYKNYLKLFGPPSKNLSFRDNLFNSKIESGQRTFNSKIKDGNN